MTAFDAEFYLRSLGERELASGLDVAHERVNGRGQLTEAATALTIAGVIDARLARTISADYESAFELRKGSAGGIAARRRARRLAQAADATPPEPLPARRVFRLARTIPLAQGTLTARTLTLTEENIRLEATVVWDPSRSANPSSGPPDLKISTPAGQSLSAGFSGSWSDGRADGRFEADANVDPELEWIEIEGTRITAPVPVTPPPVRVEALAPERVHVRHLWQLLSDFGGRHEHGGDVRAAADALIAAGRLEADDPELAAVLWVADGSNRHQQPRHRTAGTATAPAGMPEALPPQWRALLAGPASSGGPQGTLVVGVVTPVFDGVSVAVNTLTSGEDGFSITAETRGIPHPGPMAVGSALRQPVAWWASDDRGNHRLGQSGNWGSSATTGAGVISFGALDPRATELTLAVSTAAARALIPIPLDWEA